jgi:hypothetical protein
MGNDKFQDIALLSAFAELGGAQRLHQSDVDGLRKQLKTGWGKQVFATLEKNEALKPEDRLLLQGYSSVFAA